jgi:hypothetical protein
MKKHFSSGCAALGSRTTRHPLQRAKAATKTATKTASMISGGALLLFMAQGCANSGSDISGTGGGSAVPSGSGGSTTQVGSGGRTSAGTGGSIDPEGSSGGSSGTGSSESSGGSSASGGRVGAGGSAVGSGGRVGTGGSVVPGTGGAVAGPACPKPVGEICHEFVANDNRRHVINYVNEFDPTKNWTRNVGDTQDNSPRTIEIVANATAKAGKAILVSLDKGYGEFDLVDGTRLAFIQGFSIISGACRLPDGTTALANENQIIIVSATGARVRNIPIPAGANLRAINRDPATGHYWFSKDALVYEVTDQGAQVFRANMGATAKGYAVWWRAGGGAYATTGDPSTVVEIDATGAIIKTIGGKGATWPFLDFFSGFVRLPNGNFVVANWLGHIAPAADAPEIVEFNPQNQMVWRWGNQTLAAVITNVYVFR